MAEFRFSRRAEADLRSIGSYTLRAWGEAQVDLYLGELEACCKRLAGHPELGRPCSHVRPGLHRMECGKHVVFYRREPWGILASRILHQSMLPEWQAIDDEDPELRRKRR